mmetsp:Transcript_30410/g.55012  ORF Transcript_30410/g.55012 Transcript_30410/m.55012 type:complete len:194 (+) Transcript_30410:165-746(+)
MIHFFSVSLIHLRTCTPKSAKFDKNVAPSWTVTPIVSPDACPDVTNDANVQVNTQGDANDADPESPPSNDVSIRVTTQGDANATNSDSRFYTNDVQEVVSTKDDETASSLVAIERILIHCCISFLLSKVPAENASLYASFVSRFWDAIRNHNDNVNEDSFPHGPKDLSFLKLDKMLLLGKNMGCPELYVWHDC